MPGISSKAVNGSPFPVPTFVSIEFNVDNGNGTTADDYFHVPRDIVITRVRRFFSEASDSSMSGTPTTKVGTTAGGEQIVAASTVTDGASIGDYDELTIVNGSVAAGGFICVRHTGIASTQVGKYKVLIEYLPVS